MLSTEVVQEQTEKKGIYIYYKGVHVLQLAGLVQGVSRRQSKLQTYFDIFYSIFIFIPYLNAPLILYFHKLHIGVPHII